MPLAVCVALDSAESAQPGPEADLGWKAVNGRSETAHVYSWALSGFLSTLLPFFLSL